MRIRKLLHAETGHVAVLLSLVLAFAALLTVVQSLAAEEELALPADLSTSYKSVDKATAQAGEVLHYSIVIPNTGETLAIVWVTDTLPTGVTFDPASWSSTGGGSYGEAGGVITWTGAVNNGSQVTLSFDADLSAGLLPGDKITNTAVITGTGVGIVREAATTIEELPTEWYSYIPSVSRSVTVPVLLSVSRPNSSNTWSVAWSWAGMGTPVFTLQESKEPTFASPTTAYEGTALSAQITRSASTSNVYYYRVRATINGKSSAWSSTGSVIGSYYDGFGTDTGWKIRRQDTDDIENSYWYDYSEFTYEDPGAFVVRIGGRWDYAVAGPMAVAPTLPYRFTTRVRLWEPKNLNSYGLIFGGDWDGRECPNDDYSSCFNHYYRLLVIWYGDAAGRLRMQLKRIDYHDPSNNAGRGVELTPYMDVAVGTGHVPSGWNEWSIKVEADGKITIYLNGSYVTDVRDTTYINNPYFGVFASTDEYLGSRPFFDWYRVATID